MLDTNIDTFIEKLRSPEMDMLPREVEGIFHSRMQHRFVINPFVDNGYVVSDLAGRSGTTKAYLTGPTLDTDRNAASS